MPFEIVCEACQNPLLVEESGVVVECPECGAHLEIQDEPQDEPAVDTGFDFSTLMATAPNTKTTDPKATKPQQPVESDTSKTPSDFGFPSPLQVPPAPPLNLPDLHFIGVSEKSETAAETSSAPPGVSGEAATQSPPGESINLDFLSASSTPNPPANFDFGLGLTPAMESLPATPNIFNFDVLDQKSPTLIEVAEAPLAAVVLPEVTISPEQIEVIASNTPADETHGDPADCPLPETASTSEADTIPGKDVIIVPDSATPQIDAAHDVHFVEMEAEHFSRSSPQLAELIRQTAVAPSTSVAITAIDDNAQPPGDDDGLPSEEESEDHSAADLAKVASFGLPLEPISTDNVSEATTAPSTEGFTGPLAPEMQSSPDMNQDLLDPGLAGFAGGTLAEPWLTSLGGISPSPAEGEPPKASGESGDFNFGGSPTSFAPQAQTDFINPPDGHVGMQAPAGAVVSRQLFLLVAAYASAVTLALILLAMQSFRQPHHKLESLPDIKPPTTGVSVILIDPDNNVAPWHTLRLGEPRRFGNIELTPLKITRGTVTVMRPDSNEPALPSEPVLKLHLRFRNVSENQTIVPLDRELVFFKEGRFGGRSNQFIKRDGVSAKETGVVRLFDIPIRSQESIENMPLGVALAPGESVETFLPSDTGGIDELEGQLIWRLQFRKGQNPQSGNPVTTLVDVKFDSGSIEREAAAG